MKSQSALYSKFKKEFIGPILPRKIARERGIGFGVSMPADKPPRCDKKEKPLPTNLEDWRNSRHNINVIKYATPGWADKSKIKQIYKEKYKLIEKTRIDHHVDHIIPLRHPLVCGLHVENNLCIIPATDNINKTNNFKI